MFKKLGQALPGWPGYHFGYSFAERSNEMIERQMLGWENGNGRSIIIWIRSLNGSGKGIDDTVERRMRHKS